MRTPPATRHRALAALVAGVLTAGVAYVKVGQYGRPMDFGYYWAAARMLWAGGDPYQLIRAGVGAYDNGFMYPLSSAVAVMPLAPLPMNIAGVIFAAVSMACLAWALTRDSWDRWPLLLSFPCLWSVASGQWAPLVVTAALVPGFGWAAACKPTLGLAVWLYRPSWRFVWSGMAACALGFLFMPDWPARWVNATRHATSGNYHIPIMQTGGVFMLLAALRWRRSEARLLLAMSCVPQTMLMYDQLPLGLVASGRYQHYVFAIASYLIPWSARLWPPVLAMHTKAETLGFLAGWLTLFFYLPCLVLVLRRPNGEDRPGAPDPARAGVSGRRHLVAPVVDNIA